MLSHQQNVVNRCITLIYKALLDCKWPNVIISTTWMLHTVTETGEKVQYYWGVIDRIWRDVDITKSCVWHSSSIYTRLDCQSHALHLQSMLNFSVTVRNATKWEAKNVWRQVTAFVAVWNQMKLKIVTTIAKAATMSTIDYESTCDK